MAKFYGNIVKTGKLGGSVFAIRYGETIERQYQPVVANPQTDLQVKTRTKLKLMSQMAAIMTPYSGFKRVGSKTARNMFIKTNYPNVAVTASESNPSLVDATVEFGAVQLTTGLLALPQIELTENNNNVTMVLQSAASEDIDMVVYAAFVKDMADNFVAYKVQKTDIPGSNRTFSDTLLLNINSVNKLYVYAYGVSLRSDRARAMYNNMETDRLGTMAVLQAVRNMSENDALLTRTQVAYLASE